MFSNQQTKYLFKRCAHENSGQQTTNGAGVLTDHYKTCAVVQCDAIRWEKFLRRCRLGIALTRHLGMKTTLKTKYMNANMFLFLL